MTKQAARLIALILVISLSLGVLSITAFAGTNSSAYIFMFGATVSQGSSAGKIDVDFNITGMGIMDTLGAVWIDVYNSNGTKYTTVLGTVSNGLLIHNDIAHAGTYTFNCVPGNSYYCEVTLGAAKDGGSDTRTVRSPIIVAPT